MNMPQRHARESTARRNALVVVPTIQLTPEQVECLRRCARGISLRFDEPADVDALVAAGLVKQGIARVVTMTAKGLRYLQTHAD
jgi:hypothetical protein